MKLYLSKNLYKDSFADCGLRTCANIAETSIAVETFADCTIDCYPNLLPIKLISITVIKRIQVRLNLFLFDLNGRQKLMQPLKNATGSLEVNTTDYPAGMYFYKVIIDDNTTESGKLLIVK